VRRLFFAAWPPEGVAQALADWAREAQKTCGGRATQAANIHLTLSFLGDVEAEVARSRGAAVRVPAHAFRVEQARYWQHNRIVWAGPLETPAGLRQLARELGERREFAAHVTLIRKARSAVTAPLPPALEWPVTHFTLVNSVLGTAGPSYEVLETYALQ
jgi:RNA 2',3'-cyclic 3'-phosphodiesterase